MPSTADSRRGVLFIGPQRDEHAALQQIFDESPWNLHGSFTGRDGIDLLHRTHPAIRVVICEVSLPDGDWKDLLTELDKAPVRVNLIVSSRLADERLWAEALNLGAFDLLLGNPFEPEEVLRVTESAWRACTADHWLDDARHPSGRQTRKTTYDQGSTMERRSQNASPRGEAQ